MLGDMHAVFRQAFIGIRQAASFEFRQTAGPTHAQQCRAAETECLPVLIGCYIEQAMSFRQMQDAICAWQTAGKEDSPTD